MDKPGWMSDAEWEVLCVHGNVRWRIPLDEKRKDWPRCSCCAKPICPDLEPEHAQARQCGMC